MKQWVENALGSFSKDVPNFSGLLQSKESDTTERLSTHTQLHLYPTTSPVAIAFPCSTKLSLKNLKND